MTKDEAITMINAKAGAVRSCYITVAPGQEATYIIKARQCREFADAGYIGTPPGLVQAEMAATGESAQAATDRILYEEGIWCGLAAVIEQSRRSGKTAVVAATTDTEIETALQATLEQLATMMA